MFKRAVIFSMVFGSGVFAVSHAQAGQFQSIIDCTKIIRDEKRLACFDMVSEKPGDSGAGVLGTIKAKPTQEQEIADFGRQQLHKSPVKKVQEDQKKEKGKELKKVKLTVVNVVYTSTRKFVLFMENGQVWKQKEGKRIRLPKKNFEVEIKKGMVGGFNMIVPRNRSLIRVSRLK